MNEEADEEKGSVFTDPHEAPVVKGMIHGIMLTLSSAICVYNAAAYCRRPARHLAVNALVFAGVALLEIANVRRHCGEWAEAGHCGDQGDRPCGSPPLAASAEGA